MKKLLFIILLISSCVGDGLKTEQTENPSYAVSFLFEKDGCRVYRFYDGGSYRYFTTAKGSSVEWNESCGKNCTREMSIETK